MEVAARPVGRTEPLPIGDDVEPRPSDEGTHVGVWHETSSAALSLRRWADAEHGTSTPCRRRKQRSTVVTHGRAYATGQ